MCHTHIVISDTREFETATDSEISELINQVLRLCIAPKKTQLMVLQTEGKYGSYFDFFFFFKELKGSAMLTSKIKEGLEKLKCAFSHSKALSALVMISRHLIDHSTVIFLHLFNTILYPSLLHPPPPPSTPSLTFASFCRLQNFRK